VDKTDGTNPSVNTVTPAHPVTPTTPATPAPPTPLAALATSIKPESADIPVAVRETPPLPPDKRLSLSWKILIFGLVGFFLALAAGAFVAWRTTPPLDARISTDASVQVVETAVNSDAAAPETSAEPATVLPDDALLNHLPYDTAPLDTLVSIVGDGSILMREAAAEKLLTMIADAELDGVYLMPVSGFRTIEDQEYLFFDVTAERGQGPTERAEVSAPPGYSEHHTGYAVDLLDADRPDVGLVEEFEQTPAFKWLQKNAAYYSFEMSFPRDNPQGVTYEPWHWRFVGDRHSLETFYRASQLTRSSATTAEPSAAPDGGNAQ
jgi:zinc D-Ala-D-Ala carboxypeptidase